MGLVGDRIATAVPVVFNQYVTRRDNEVSCFTSDRITGLHGHGAAPALSTDSALTQTGMPTPRMSAFRPAFVLNPASAATALSSAPEGRFTLQGFHQLLIAPGLADPDAAVRAAIGTLKEWWCAACTNDVNGDPVNHAVSVPVGGPVAQQKLSSWVNRIKNSQNTRLGQGGPGLTNAAFNAGISTLNTVITDANTSRLDFERARAQKSFSEKHGDMVAQKMYYLTGAADDTGLPEVHGLLAKATKGRDYGILQYYIHERAEASTVPLSKASSPLATPTLLDDVFRTMQPGGPGVEFGRNLTPFAIICDGQKEAMAVAKTIKKAEIAESGTSLTLADAERLTVTDARFPANPQTAAEKLYGWSIVVDLFHGTAHPTSITVREFVLEVGPNLHRIYDQYIGEPAKGMDIVCRVLFEAQQSYFAWCSRVVSQKGGAARLDLSDISGKVGTFRADSLSRMPAIYYTMMEAPRTDPNPEPRGRGNNRRNSPRDRSGSTTDFPTVRRTACISVASETLVTQPSRALWKDTPWRSLSTLDRTSASLGPSRESVPLAAVVPQSTSATVVPPTRPSVLSSQSAESPPHRSECPRDLLRRLHPRI